MKNILYALTLLCILFITGCDNKDNASDKDIDFLYIQNAETTYVSSNSANEMKFTLYFYSSKSFENVYLKSISFSQNIEYKHEVIVGDENNDGYISSIILTFDIIDELKVDTAIIEVNGIEKKIHIDSTISIIEPTNDSILTINKNNIIEYKPETYRITLKSELDVTIKSIEIIGDYIDTYTYEESINVISNQSKIIPIRISYKNGSRRMNVYFKVSYLVNDVEHFYTSTEVEVGSIRNLINDIKNK